jgi:hypothetical protein
MKKGLLIALLMLSGAAQANVLCMVDGYTKTNGTVVASYVRNQTACVTTTPASSAGGLSASTAAKILSGVGIIVGLIQLHDAYNNSVVDDIRKEDHKIVECKPSDALVKELQLRGFGGPVPGIATIFVGKEKMIILSYSVIYTGMKVHHTSNFSRTSDEGIYKSTHIFYNTLFDANEAKFPNFKVKIGRSEVDMYSCKITYEIKIKDEDSTEQSL